VPTASGDGSSWQDSCSSESLQANASIVQSMLSLQLHTAAAAEAAAVQDTATSGVPRGTTSNAAAMAEGHTHPITGAPEQTADVNGGNNDAVESQTDLRATRAVASGAAVAEQREPEAIGILHDLSDSSKGGHPTATPRSSAELYALDKDGSVRSECENDDDGNRPLVVAAWRPGNKAPGTLLATGQHFRGIPVCHGEASSYCELCRGCTGSLSQKSRLQVVQLQTRVVSDA
jgi:hypothetical protein